MKARQLVLTLAFILCASTALAMDTGFWGAIVAGGGAVCDDGLVENGCFDGLSPWYPFGNTGVSVSGGVATITRGSDTDDKYLMQDMPELTLGASYTIYFTVVNGPGDYGGIRPFVGYSACGGNEAVNGTYSCTFTLDSIKRIGFELGTSTAGQGVSIKDIKLVAN